MENTNEVLIDLNTIVSQNYQESEFNVDKFSYLAGISKSSLYRKIKKYYNCSPHDYIIHLRFKKAIQLLTTTNYSISEVAYDTGFTDPRYFSKRFKSFFGYSPNECRVKLN